MFNRIVAQDLSTVNVKSTILQYVDDLLICSPPKEQCVGDSITGLTELTKKDTKLVKTNYSSVGKLLSILVTN